jgi:hypothetical protein
MKPASRIASILLGLVALLQLLRIVRHVEVTVGGTPIPMWPSGVAVVVAGTLSFLLWRESRG